MAEAASSPSPRDSPRDSSRDPAASPRSDREDNNPHSSETGVMPRSASRIAALTSGLRSQESSISRLSTVFGRKFSGTSGGSEEKVSRATVAAAVAQRFGADSLPGRQVSGNVKKGLTAGFIPVLNRQDSDSSLNVSYQAHAIRKYLSMVLRDPRTEIFLGLVLLFNVGLVWMEVDCRAADLPVPAWIDASVNVCFAIYTIEFAAVVVVKRLRIFISFWSMLDLVVIVAGLAEIVASSMEVGVSTDSAVGSINIARLFRFLRMARLLRIVRKFAVLKDFQRIFQMVGSCMRSLTCTFTFVFLMMSLWGMVAVEFMYPLARQLSEEGVWADNPINERQLASVMRANLLLFQTIIANDAWGEVALPLIVRYPWTAALFVGIYLVLCYGFLNLVIAAAVDAFVDRRQKDFTFLAAEMDAEQEQDMRDLRKMFAKLDADGSGDMSFEELTDGIKSTPEFRHRLRVMDVDEEDLQQLFRMLDEDGSGTVEPEEFIYFLNRWMLSSRTADRFAKYNSMLTLEKQERMEEALNLTLKKIEERMDSFEKMLRSTNEASGNGHSVRYVEAEQGKEVPSARRKDVGAKLEFIAEPGSPVVAAAEAVAKQLQESLEKAGQVMKTQLIEAAEKTLQNLERESPRGDKKAARVGFNLHEALPERSTSRTSASTNTAACALGMVPVSQLVSWKPCVNTLDSAPPPPPRESSAVDICGAETVWETAA
eukprot:TRINITY_DN33832_c0_g1_i2.p1 TRINITY_DN33832_c0_g1~~TRINITY_DN33832_c0_g1_i2.p1  ORF type:complete len:722 (-),score=137.88 TRINITY_DN33832_c0_g1_i2:241-2376(-)